MLGFLGALAGAITAAIATPFYKVSNVQDVLEVLELGVIDVRETVTYGTLFGHLGEFLVGALVASFIVIPLVRRRGFAQSAFLAMLAFAIGGLLNCGVDALLDLSFIETARSLFGSYRADMGKIYGLQTLWTPLWYICSPGSIALAILITSGFTRYYRGLALWATLFGAVFGFVARTFAGLVIIPLFVVGAMTSNDPTQALAGAGAAEFAAMYIAQGAGIGLGFGLAAVVYQKAWLKSVRGASEGRRWNVSGQIARIGCMEGVEVYLPPDGTVAPVHAQIQAEDDAHFIVDVAGGSTVNGQPVQQTWLKDGDTIGVGSALILYRNRIDAVGKEKPSAPQMHIRQFALVDDRGVRHLLHPGANTVGRELDCDVSITHDPSVSRRHAAIVVGQSGVTVRDLGSTNGTFLQGQTVTTETPVNTGAEIVFGRCRTRIEVGS